LFLDNRRESYEHNDNIIGGYAHRVRERIAKRQARMKFGKNLKWLKWATIPLWIVFKLLYKIAKTVFGGDNSNG